MSDHVSSPNPSGPSISLHREEQALTAVVTRHLDESLDRLDPVTLIRLREARAQALHSRAPARWTFQSWLRPVSLGLALVTAVLAVVWLGSPSSQNEMLPLEDIELLASAEPLEFYEELEFYHWLAVEDHAG